VTISFCLGLEEQPSGAVRPCFSFEIRVPISGTLQAAFERDVISGVTGINADLRVAVGEHRDSVLPVVRLYPLREGPFGRDNGRIKQTRVLVSEVPS
jgi:hypothetical protein